MKKIVLILLLIVACFLGYYALFPDISRLKKENPKKTAFMEYREEEWRHKGKRLVIQQKWAPLSRVSPLLIKAVLIAEDDKFWSHRGFDIDAMQKALEKDLKAKKLKFGGSTISQQLAKNLYLSPSKNPLRKIKEAVITWRLERALSKKRILELYLNVAEWGEGIFGIEAASRHYYGKPASTLNAEESARLAAVLPNPRRYRADGTSRYVEKRTRIIYDIMVRRGIVIPEYEDLVGDSGKIGHEGTDMEKGILGEHQNSQAPPGENPAR
ncbi:MAG: monofunctional biosynthetic peptidoglycan transglycosylase [Syntrophus sp. (in: bacteria)]|nr:monofunctional biosynthetic peptidoglycan transglycosylase [Syntrophus sp. (in: bacteria)]